MPQVISFINMKGGVGKTTLAVNIGHALASKHDKKVLIVDCDPQFNASTYLMKEKEYLEHITNDKKHSILDIFIPTRKKVSVSTVTGVAKKEKKGTLTLKSCVFKIFDGGEGLLELVPSTLAVIEIENSPRGTENRLHNFIKEKANGYDYVLIDCPPHSFYFHTSSNSC